MDHLRPQRDESAGVGPSRRPPKRPRIHSMSNAPDPQPRTPPRATPGVGPSNRTNGPADIVTVPPSVRLPDFDIQGRRTVIDLTADSPPPEIIDVDALPDRPNSFFENQDLNVMFARRRFRGPGLARPMEPSPFDRRGPPPNEPRFYQELGNPGVLGNAARLFAGRVEEQLEMGNRAGADVFVGAAGDFIQALTMRAGFPGWFRGGNGLGRLADWTFGAPNMDANFQAPGNLDYRMGANGIVLDSPPAEDQAARQREAEYKAPPKAKEGFTRSPVGEDVLVCPSCDYELGVTTPEDKAQGTVWIGKCGHCYCGKCAASIKNMNPRARKAKTGPSGFCVVEGCRCNLKGKNLWEIFL